jgi:hypothetical protein
MTLQRTGSAPKAQPLKPDQKDKAFMRYFLITGMAKSGTTWVQRICNAHPEMHCRAEDQFTKIWGRISDLTADYNSLVERRDRERDQQGIDALTRDDATKLFYAMVKITMDKAPAGTTWSGIKDLVLSGRGFLQLIPGARVINVIRDPRDIAISANAHARRIVGKASNELTGIEDRMVVDTCRYWLQQMRLVENARHGFPGLTHDIRYEDLAADFSAAARALMTFLDVDAGRETIEGLRRETDFKRLSGGRPPGETDPGSYFRKGIAGDWRQTLTEAQITIADEVCGDQLAAYGYDRR